MNNSDPNQPERPSTYELLMRQSRKMGILATRTLSWSGLAQKNKTSDSDSESSSSSGNTKIPSPDSDSSDKKSGKKSPMKRAEALLFGKKADESSHSVTAKEAKAIKKVVSQSHEILGAARTVLLPVNLFPDTITVDRTKVTITRRTFFWTSEVITMRIDDILAVTSNFGPFFGSLTISTRIMNSTDHFEVHYFWRKDAEYIKQLIQGYVIAQHNDIETKHLERDELVDTLLELGRDSQF